MAIITGTANVYGQGATGVGGSNREDLSDTIYDLFPDDTYFLTNLDKEKASGVFHEWLTDTLAAAAANSQVEGDDTTFASFTHPNRLGNYTQIFKKSFIVSGSQEAVKKAGRRSDVARQAVKQMRELKNDIEFALVRNAAGAAGSAAGARTSAGMESWIGDATSQGPATAGQVVRATTTASATTAAVTSGAPSAPTDGTTTGALSEAALRSALQGAWTDGGQTDIIAVSAAVKNSINAFTGIATRNVDVGRQAQASITGAADLYVSNYGVHRILLHRHVRTSVALCLDSSSWAVAKLRDFFMEPLARTGDAEKRQILFEGCLVARSPTANAKVVAIT